MVIQPIMVTCQLLGVNLQVIKYKTPSLSIINIKKHINTKGLSNGIYR
jgi:hypothetical protein